MFSSQSLCRHCSPQVNRSRSSIPPKSSAWHQVQPRWMRARWTCTSRQMILQLAAHTHVHPSTYSCSSRVVPSYRSGDGGRHDSYIVLYSMGKEAWCDVRACVQRAVWEVCTVNELPRTAPWQARYHPFVYAVGGSAPGLCNHTKSNVERQSGSLLLLLAGLEFQLTLAGRHFCSVEVDHGIILRNGPSYLSIP